MKTSTAACVAILLAVAHAASKVKSTRYEATWESLDKRPIPQWFEEAKFGIFLHWGLFSVPGIYAWLWYLWKGPNPQMDVVQYMEANYPPDWTYADFGPQFKTEFFDPYQWADIFNASGARYVVLTTKHHEGYCMWPSKYSWNWNSMDVGPNRDLVGELAAAVRSKTNLKFGTYHSLYEFFNPLYLADKKNNFKTQDFIRDKTMPELYELVNAYKPDIIWSDGDWEANSTYWNATNFIAWLYNDSPVKDTVVVNDRWGADTRCKHGGYWTCVDYYNPGLRERPPSPKRVALQLKNKDYCKKWRNALKLDTERASLQRLKDMHRNRRNRRRPKTEEEKARTNELARLRVAKSRAKIKAEKEAEALLSSGPGEPRSTRSKQRKDENAVAAQRAKWREWKRKEHSKWTAQHWRRHRERNLHAYYARKAPEKGVIQKHKFEDSTTMDKHGWSFRKVLKLSDINSMDELTETLARVVSCGGNVILNVGPTPAGRILPIFEERLRQMGQWLGVNGEAIYATHPWIRANDTVSGNVWYTSKKADGGGTNVYAIMLDWPEDDHLTLGLPVIANDTKVSMLGYSGAITFGKNSQGQMVITMPIIPINLMPCDYAWVFKIQGLSNA